MNYRNKWHKAIMLLMYRYELVCLMSPSGWQFISRNNGFNWGDKYISEYCEDKEIFQELVQWIRAKRNK